jgi:hypothetical protein
VWPKAPLKFASNGHQGASTIKASLWEIAGELTKIFGLVNAFFFLIFISFVDAICHILLSLCFVVVQFILSQFSLLEIQKYFFRNGSQTDFKLIDHVNYNRPHLSRPSMAYAPNESGVCNISREFSKNSIPTKISHQHFGKGVHGFLGATFVE